MLSVQKRFLVLSATTLSLLGALAGLINLDSPSLRSSQAASLPAAQGLTAGVKERQLYDSLASTLAQNFTERAKLLANDGATSDQFGYSVAISGETAVVGAPFDDTAPNVNQGAAYVFVFSGGNWIQQQKLTANDGATSDEFGFAVTISGDTIVVGAHEDDIGTNSNQGSAYVFVRAGGVWTQQQKLTASDGAASDDFGFAVATSGETVVVGARTDDIGAETNQGSAYVFTRGGGVWTQQQRLTASDGSLGDEFGYSVAISGETIVVGAHTDDVGTAAAQGSAYVFARSGGAWAQQQRLIANDGRLGDRFGSSVGLSSETAIIGAPFDDLGAADQGSAYVFVRSGTSWTQQAKLTADDGAASDLFGNSVAISGETAVAGARFDDVNATNQGSAYVYGRGGSVWSQQQKLTASDGAVTDQFGHSAAISGNTLLAGAPFGGAGTPGNQGAVYVFTTVPSCLSVTGFSPISGAVGSAVTIIGHDGQRRAVVRRRDHFQSECAALAEPAVRSRRHTERQPERHD
jgi:hypothetical protein